MLLRQFIKMDSLALTFLVLECVNLGIAVIFLILFLHRIISIKDCAVTEQYLKQYPKIRIILAFVYIVISVTIIIFNLIVQTFDDEIYYLVSGGTGECINSIILILQLIVLRQELRRQQPYTIIHLIYSIYLLLISCTRFIITLYYMIEQISNVKQSTIQKVDLVLSAILFIDSALLLGYWIVRRRDLPYFIDPNQFNAEQFRTQSLMAPFIRHQSIRYNSNFPYIKSAVFVEKNKFKIVLVLLKMEQNRQSKYEKKISDKIYTLQQIKEFYVTCGRLDIQQKIDFDSQSQLFLAANVQAFLNALFELPINYQPFILSFFDLEEHLIEEYSLILRGRSSFLESNFSRMDQSSSFISIAIYKQLWLENHYQFYLRVVSIDGVYKSHPSKRYSDFEEFDSKLRSIIKTNHWKLVLPTLPKKHLFFNNQEKINIRRKQLQLYIRKISNDSILMGSKFPQIRQLIFQFVEFKNCFQVTPTFNHGFFYNLQIKKDVIKTTLIENDLVTFYYFKLMKNGKEVSLIYKRFSQFAALHEDIQRWIHNNQKKNLNIFLPEKHLIKSKQHRHNKLYNYLKNLIKLEEAFEIYQLVVFLNAPDRNTLDQSIFSSFSLVNHPQSRVQSKSKTLHNIPRQIKQQEQINVSSPEIELEIPQSLRSSSINENIKINKMIEDLGKSQYSGLPSP